VVTAGESGVSAGAINTLARAVNSFLTWLHREGHYAEHLKIPKVKQPKRIIPTYTADDVHRWNRRGVGEVFDLSLFDREGISNVDVALANVSARPMYARSETLKSL
jgi:hypothetical protein